MGKEELEVTRLCVLIAEYCPFVCFFPLFNTWIFARPYWILLVLHSPFALYKDGGRPCPPPAPPTPTPAAAAHALDALQKGRASRTRGGGERLPESHSSKGVCCMLWAETQKERQGRWALPLVRPSASQLPLAARSGPHPKSRRRKPVGSPQHASAFLTPDKLGPASLAVSSCMRLYSSMPLYLYFVPVL